jgi:hypothetical protein
VENLAPSATPRNIIDLTIASVLSAGLVRLSLVFRHLNFDDQPCYVPAVKAICEECDAKRVALLAEEPKGD